MLGGELSGVRNAVDYMWARECELEGVLGEETYRAVETDIVGGWADGEIGGCVVKEW
eukprot:FN603938.1.p2 GENE.FN603938.1~~FN603938.1.p2  ORF type:complete len:57 (+),score=9.89 FN603938.1:37-207(+)